jgi:hypothetical protein
VPKSQGSGTRTGSERSISRPSAAQRAGGGDVGSHFLACLGRAESLRVRLPGQFVLVGFFADLHSFLNPALCVPYSVGHLPPDIVNRIAH